MLVVGDGSFYGLGGRTGRCVVQAWQMHDGDAGTASVPMESGGQFGS
jgi:hypothetical protein